MYDGFYDIAPTDRQIGQTLDAVDGPMSAAGITDAARPRQRGDGLKFENTLREAYIDAKLKDAPVSFRIGRQQVIWGESDQFRLMDIWNPLDVTWHFQQESWDNIRIPLWLAKGLWDIGELGPLSNTLPRGGLQSVRFPARPEVRLPAAALGVAVPESAAQRADAASR